MTLRLQHALKPRLAPEGLPPSTRPSSGRWSPCVADMELAGIKVDRADAVPRCRDDFGGAAWPSWRREVHRLAGRPSTSARPSRWARCCSTRWAWPGGKKGKTGAYVDRRRHCWRRWPRRATSCRAAAGLAPARQAEEHLHRQPGRQQIDPKTGRVHTSFALAATTTGRLVLDRSEPAEHPDPHRGRPQDPPGLHRRAGPRAAVGRLLARSNCGCWPHMADIAALKQAFRDGIDIHAMTASEVFGVPVEGMTGEVRRTRQGDQFRHHLRHQRRSASAGSSAFQPGEAKRLHQDLLRALPRHPRLHGPHQGVRARATATSRPCFGRQLPHPGHRRQEPRPRASSPTRRRSTRRSRARPPTSSSAP